MNNLLIKQQEEYNKKASLEAAIVVKLKPNRTDFDRNTNESGGIIIKGNTGSDR